MAIRAARSKGVTSRRLTDLSLRSWLKVRSPRLQSGETRASIVPSPLQRATEMPSITVFLSPAQSGLLTWGCSFSHGSKPWATDLKPASLAQTGVRGLDTHFREAVLRRTLACLCATALLIAACQQRETPQWAPNVERTDITPSEWMLGCFAIDPMTDILRAAGARQEIELTARRVKVVEGRQWYGVEMNRSHQKYGMWSPVAASKVRLQVGSNGFDGLTYVLSRSDVGLAGTYTLVGDVSPGSGPEVPVSLRRVPCVSAPAS